MRRLRSLLAVALAAAPLSLVADVVSVRSAAAAPDDDWNPQGRDPFDLSVVGQHKGFLARDPHDARAFADLVRMYRSYRTLELLKQEYAKVLEKTPDNWAALVVLGKLHNLTGDQVKALEQFQKAVAAKDADAQTWITIGEILKVTDKKKEARAAYDKALANTTNKELKKKSLRSLADLALAAGENDAADKYFKQFLDLDPNNAQLWIERGDAMLTANKRDVALESYAKAETLLGTDPQRRVEVIARRGQALEGMSKDDEAVAEYRRAIKSAPKGYYLEVELTGRIVDIYRRKQALPVLLAQYEKEWPDGSRRHFEWSTLGKLYEETGAQDKAITSLRRAVAASPFELDTQRRLIQLLENSGKDEEALKQYEEVVRVAPGEARFQLDLAERYWRRGGEKKALDVLSRLQGRFPNDPGVLSAIADMYGRWGKEELAIAQYEKLTKLEPDDTSHLVTLGEQYWAKGDRPRAMATWKAIIKSGKASGYAKLAEMMHDHGIKTDALANYAKAIEKEPKNPEWYKGRAAVWEADKRYEEALKDWDMVLSLLGTKASDRLARREARKKYVSVITRWPQREPAKKKEWIDGFKNGEGNVELGYFLAEYYARPGKGDKEQPQRTLEILHKKAPDDNDILNDLVKVYRSQRKFDQAVALLLELAKAQPNLEATVFRQIAEIKTDARQDKEAMEWQQKVLAKNPRDPGAYADMGARLVEMQKFSEAIEQYEKALTLQANNTKVQFALSQLYVQSGQPMKAAELLRAILRTAQQPPDVARAGRAAIDLEEMTDTLGELEKVVSPLSFVMSHRPEFRHVVVDLYLRYVPRLVHRERHGNEEVRKAAHAELIRIGGHGLQPLLEALRDDKDPNQQRVAVTVLGHLGNKGAAGPLVHMARQEPSKDGPRHIGTLQESVDREVRVEALVAAGRLGEAKVIDDVLPLMVHPEVAMREAATFTLGRSGDRRAIPHLLTALADRRPSVQALACLGLAQIDDPRTVPALVSTLADPRREDATRAAAAYGLGLRRAASAMPTLIAALTDNRGEAQRLAAWALGQIGDAKTLGPLMRAYFSRAGRSSDEMVWAIGRVSGAGLAPAPMGALGEYPLGRGKYDPVAAVGLLPGALPPASAPTKLVVEHPDDIGKGLVDALGEHRDVVVSVLADLDNAAAQISLGALSPPSAEPKVVAALAKIGDAIAPAITAQLASEDPKVRALAVSVFAKLDGPKRNAEAAVAKALGDATDLVRTSAMNAIVVLHQRRGGAPSELLAALSKTLGSPSWADRRAAALAMGRLGPAADHAALIKAAGDSLSFVREAVATALAGATQPGTLDAVLKLSTDDVPQVRIAAARALYGASDERAKKRIAELEKDAHPEVRAAAKGVPPKSDAPADAPKPAR
ncbi:MAG: HEAT repeat domain-containing protein [Deltaproteobacteria bacterium]|nr:HEAT repeat domain-containing protein [Deltaproteobacteria bacterium]